MENLQATQIYSSSSSTVHFSKILIIILSIIVTVSAACYWSSFVTQDEENNPILPATSINQACNTTLNPSLCFAKLSSTAHSSRVTSFSHLLEVSITEVISLVSDVRFRFIKFSSVQELTSKNMNAFSDCLEMLELSLDELHQALEHVARGGMRDKDEYFYQKLKTLLSAVMTNENTCIEGFYEYKRIRSRKQKMLKDYIHGNLDPISTTISYCLAIITSMGAQESYKVSSELLLSKTAGYDKFPKWIAFSDRNLMEGSVEFIPNVTVAADGTGDYKLINEAVRMAPNRSMSRYIVHIRGGVYNEVVRITRDKTNIVLIGDGMSSTVITGSRNVADGFTTFTSATLTVTGDKFLARDLTVINTAGPQKRQAVAVRVTSNAAFYRCNFTSYQDTLYAHSLCQFYRECTIQGTIDFIFGNAAAVFQNCRILARKPMLGQKNMITAQGRSDPNQNTGILIQNSAISSALGFTITDMKYYPTFLGRPWRNFSRTIVMKSYLGHMIHPQGWFPWDQYSNLNTVEYVECMNFGPGANTRNRVTWGGYKNSSSDEMVNEFAVGKFLLGVDDWLDTTGFPLHYGS